MSGDITDGMESSRGDPKLLIVLNLVLSAVFAYIVLWLSEFVGLTSFTFDRYLAFTLILVVVTFIVTRP